MISVNSDAIEPSGGTRAVSICAKDTFCELANEVGTAVGEVNANDTVSELDADCTLLDVVIVVVVGEDCGCCSA